MPWGESKKVCFIQELCHYVILFTIFGCIWWFWAWIGNITSWFGFGRAFEPFLVILAIPVFFLSYVGVIFAFYGAMCLIYGSPKPVSQYTREDAVTEIESFIEGDWYSDDDFYAFCGHKFDDPLIAEASSEISRVLSILPCGENELLRLREIRDEMLANLTPS